ncbi:hypothetical protein ACI3PL_20950, partial [Lacticaseibacillus paracasei]
MDGTFKVKSTATIDRFVDLLGAVKGFSAEARSLRFMQAIALLLSLEQFEADRLKQKMRTAGSTLEPCSHRDQMLQ